MLGGMEARGGEVILLLDLTPKSFAVVFSNFEDLD